VTGPESVFATVGLAFSTSAQKNITTNITKH